MAKGTITGTTGNVYISSKIEWSSTADNANNKSTITATLYYKKSSDVTVATSGYYKGSITINGETTNITANLVLSCNNTWQKAGSANATVAHDADGSKLIAISATGSISGTTFTYTSLEDNAVKLDTIPRASSITSASNITLGNNFSIKWTPASTTFKYRVKLTLGSWSLTLPSSTTYITPKTTSAYTYTYDSDNCFDNICVQLPSATSGTITATLTTYNSSGSKIGSSSTKTFTVTLPLIDALKPTCGTLTLTPTPINGNNILVKGKNALTLSVSGCTAGTGSKIKSYTFSGPSFSKTISSSDTSASTSISSVSSVGTLTYKVTVTDTRGRTNSSSEEIICQNYYAPSFDLFEAYRADSDGSVNINGTYLMYKYNEKHASIKNLNDDETNIIAVTVCYSDGKDSIEIDESNEQLPIDLNGDKDTTYQVYLKIVDSYGGDATSSVITVFGSTRIFNITQDGTGFAIGKMAESSELFECRWEAKFDGDVSGPNGFSTSSDKRVKKNIQDINIDIIDNLRPIQYELIQSTDGKTHYGFVAQEVEGLLSDAGVNPEFLGIIGQVTNKGQKEYVLTYTEFIPLLTKKCQDLQSETNMLKQEIAELKDIIAKLI